MTEKLKILKIIHFAICTGTLVIYFFLGSISSIENLNFLSMDYSSAIFLLIPILAIIVSNFIFKLQIKNVEPTLGLSEKLPIYQTASIARWAILEGAAILIIILKPDFLIFGIFLIIYLLFLAPTEEKIKSDFENVRI